jgi:hypothetical protein
MIDRRAFARVLAATGLVCGLLALWVGNVLAGAENSIRYWDDGTLSGLLLILVVVSALLLAVGLARGHAFDVAATAVGSVVFGLYLFEPVTAGVDRVGSASWLGACSALVPLAALLSRLPQPGAPRITRSVGALTLLMLAGGGLLLAGLWLDLFDGDVLTYWSFGRAGHKAGITLLVLTPVAVAGAFGLWHGEPVPFGMPSAFAGTVCGFALFIPVAVAFDGLNEIGTGAWVAAAGGLALVFAIGTASVLRVKRDSRSR